MSNGAHRSVEVTRTSLGRYAATNARGGTIPMGTGEDDDFTPVELLLAAIGGCTAVDVDHLTSRLAEPDAFTVTVGAEKLNDELGNHLGPVTITFEVAFPAAEQGDAARARLPQAARSSHDRLCTVSRTVMLETPVETVVLGHDEHGPDAPQKKEH